MPNGVRYSAWNQSFNTPVAEHETICTFFHKMLPIITVSVPFPDLGILQCYELTTLEEDHFR